MWFIYLKIAVTYQDIINSKFITQAAAHTTVVPDVFSMNASAVA
ncbi:MAG: hypothetical protein V7K86_23525 [Nostoc sp.]